jgi:transposase InsO family protein
VYLLHYKSKAFVKFKQFKQLVENQINYQIKVLRVDNGGEYKLKEFTQLCQECPIQRQFTIPYTPQQNGVA